jgi:hypothetical protein
MFGGRLEISGIWQVFTALAFSARQPSPEPLWSPWDKTDIFARFGTGSA